MPFPSELFQIDPVPAWCLVVLCAALVGFAKSGIPGVGIVVVPLMAIAFPANQSVGILLPMLVVGDICAVCYYRRHAVWKHVLRALPWAFLGILLAFAWQYFFPPSDMLLKRLLGSIVLLMLGLGEWVRRLRKNTETFTVPHHWAFAMGIGIVGGFMTFAANAAGPIFVVYLLALSLPKETFLGTSGWLFLILNTVKLPFQWARGVIWPASLAFNAMLIPAILLGGLLGIFAVKRINQKAFDIAVKVLTAAAAIKLLIG